jgi:hypothetical protein
MSDDFVPLEELECFKQVADVLGYSRAMVELAKVNIVNPDGSLCGAFDWTASPQNHWFWESVAGGNLPTGLDALPETEELRPGITRIKKEGDDVCIPDNKGNPYKPTPSKAHQAFADASKSDGSTASYYELPEGAKELQELISHRNMNAQLGEIFRACYRYGIVSHSEELRDAKKIKFYAEAEIARLEKLKND